VFKLVTFNKFRIASVMYEYGYFETLDSLKRFWDFIAGKYYTKSLIICL